MGCNGRRNKVLSIWFCTSSLRLKHLKGSRNKREKEYVLNVIVSRFSLSLFLFLFLPNIYRRVHLFNLNAFRIVGSSLLFVHFFNEWVSIFFFFISQPVVSYRGREMTIIKKERYNQPTRRRQGICYAAFTTAVSNAAVSDEFWIFIFFFIFKPEELISIDMNRVFFFPLKMSVINFHRKLAYKTVLAKPFKMATCLTCLCICWAFLSLFVISCQGASDASHRSRFGSSSRHCHRQENPPTDRWRDDERTSSLLLSWADFPLFLLPHTPSFLSHALPHLIFFFNISIFHFCSIELLNFLPPCATRLVFSRPVSRCASNRKMDWAKQDEDCWINQ